MTDGEAEMIDTSALRPDTSGMRPLVFAILTACYTAPPPSAPAPRNRTPSAPHAIADDDKLCCCTFDFADPDLDIGIRKWDSQAQACATGVGTIPKGRCIPWSWCGYAPGREPKSLAERPDLRPPPPIAKTDCCCNHASGVGEEMSVVSRDVCAATPDSVCIDAGFCDRNDAP